MPSFSVSSYVSNTQDITLLNAATVYLEVIIHEGGSDAVAGVQDLSVILKTLKTSGNIPPSGSCCGKSSAVR